MLRDFREFALKGNVVDLAVGIIIGTAFGAIVTSLVGDITSNGPITTSLGPAFRPPGRYRVLESHYPPFSTSCPLALRACRGYETAEL